MNADIPRSKPRHPIGVAAERTGLSPDVLRVWERRYQAVEPDRSEGRQRLYSDDDIERLRLLRLATLPGRGISSVVSFSTPDLARMVDEDAAARVQAAPSADGAPADAALIDEAIMRVHAFDAVGLDWLLRRSASELGIAGFIEQLAAPLLRRVGDEWHAGRLSIAQEHHATSLVRGVLIGALQAGNPPSDAPAVVVATTAGERHEVGALFVAALALAQGWRVTYLGADLPADDIVHAATSTNARAVAISVVAADAMRVVSELGVIRRALPPDVALIVGGSGSADVAPSLAALGIRVIDRFPQMDALLDR